MSSTFNAEQYPNQLLGLTNVQSTNAGASNRLFAPLKLDTAGTTTGAMIQSGSGAPRSARPQGASISAPTRPPLPLSVFTSARLQVRLALRRGLRWLSNGR